MSWGFNQGGAAYNQGSISISWPTITTAGTALPYYVPLQPVTDPASERDVRANRELTPVEWLTRQVDDVCRLARAA